MQELLRHLRGEYPAQVEDHVRSMHADHQHQIANLEAEIGVRRASLGEVETKQAQTLLSQPWQATPNDRAVPCVQSEGSGSLAAWQAARAHAPPVVLARCRGERPHVIPSSSAAAGLALPAPSLAQGTTLRHEWEDGESPLQTRATSMEVEAGPVVSSCEANLEDKRPPASPLPAWEQQHAPKEKSPHSSQTSLPDPVESSGGRASKASHASRGNGSVSRKVVERSQLQRSPAKVMPSAGADARPSRSQDPRRPSPSSTRRPSPSPQRGRQASRAQSPQPAPSAQSSVGGGSRAALAAASPEPPRSHPQPPKPTIPTAGIGRDDADSALEPPAELFTRVRTALARVVGKKTAVAHADEPGDEQPMDACDVTGQRVQPKYADNCRQSPSMLAGEFVGGAAGAAAPSPWAPSAAPQFCDGGAVEMLKSQPLASSVETLQPVPEPNEPVVQQACLQRVPSDTSRDDTLASWLPAPPPLPLPSSVPILPCDELPSERTCADLPTDRVSGTPPRSGAGVASRSDARLGQAPSSPLTSSAISVAQPNSESAAFVRDAVHVHSTPGQAQFHDHEAPRTQAPCPQNLPRAMTDVTAARSDARSRAAQAEASYREAEAQLAELLSATGMQRPSGGASRGRVLGGTASRGRSGALRTASRSRQRTASPAPATSLVRPASKSPARTLAPQPSQLTETRPAHDGGSENRSSSRQRSRPDPDSATAAACPSVSAEDIRKFLKNGALGGAKGAVARGAFR